MCGIVGIYLKTKKYEKHLGKFLSGMLDGMATRGPDSAGFAIYSKEKKGFYKYSICLNNLTQDQFKNGLLMRLHADVSQNISVAITERPTFKNTIECMSKRRFSLLQQLGVYCTNNSP